MRALSCQYDVNPAGSQASLSSVASTMSEVFLKLVSGNDVNDAEDIMAVMLMVVLFVNYCTMILCVKQICEEGVGFEETTSGSKQMLPTGRHDSVSVTGTRATQSNTFTTGCTVQRESSIAVVTRTHV